MLNGRIFYHRNYLSFAAHYSLILVWFYPERSSGHFCDWIVPGVKNRNVSVVRKPSDDENFVVINGCKHCSEAIVSDRKYLPFALTSDKSITRGSFYRVNSFISRMPTRNIQKSALNASSMGISHRVQIRTKAPLVSNGIVYFDHSALIVSCLKDVPVLEHVHYA